MQEKAGQQSTYQLKIPPQLNKRQIESIYIVPVLS